jgi:hypothetical protein
MDACPVATLPGGPHMLLDLLAVAVGVAVFGALYMAIDLIDRT